ncbi:ABC transporter ATP-binding protein [Frankia sp. CNm7]|uniref:ABC transporter ATP-binding protein n=2 Tax=Frankia nepalensis TaxID=1836974 RepID=A0A937RJL1_9ACTN|nr:ABC transporter ATP-binding protein [Frankia nepalensis]MBL7508825.1 ABC transporter ATP-binding protein [Frankia nepalensis]MBL7519355.1 ABC transporter ATP-binding protein [Frankia nepalensis]MBL7630049.1 ABC transporter ATP-binding protein [Frankia nepalensis]
MTGTGARPALRVTDVTVRFGGVVGLDGVSLDVGRDEVVGVIGPNGAGKTTLFDVTSGLRSPASGRVWLDGADVTRRSATWRARHGLRRTFQRQQVFGELTVLDNLLAAQEWRGRTGGIAADVLGLSRRLAVARARRRRAEEMLDLCGLAGSRDAYAATLPIGQARLLELARAVVDRPTVLLLDEPTSGLGDAGSAVLAEAITRIRREQGCGVVLVEHDVPFVMRHCHRVVVLNLGRVIAAGTPDEVRADRLVREAYLG